MVDRESGTSNVAIVAIIVLVLIVIAGLFFYFRSDRSAGKIIEKPESHIETPTSRGGVPERPK